MASQTVTIFAIGGKLADAIWQQVQRCYALRLTDDPQAWAPEQWPISIRNEVDALASHLLAKAFTPPILYRSQYVDLWSGGEFFEAAMGVSPAASICHLLTEHYEVYVRHTLVSDIVPRNPNKFDEYRWLERRLAEAFTAWEGFAEERVIVLVREVLGGLWEDQDVGDSLKQIPGWWKNA
ncbi:hypothetical protein [Blastopirellula marina]|uniref:Uncharacterized protein n=1 Tax=Blastopirellula marina TaxID=124 RepID=A0A2S8GBC8_9BACT|nr:hypothetical protein [Blastopirellula marina]PQO41719.1 hypothetical protein C5Y98_03075 [Blastopirellula marina]PTL46162.1 hypothetical protein C5Y97_03075 [Blastopirellula marina]